MANRPVKGQARRTPLETALYHNQPRHVNYLLRYCKIYLLEPAGR